MEKLQYVHALVKTDYGCINFGRLTPQIAYYFSAYLDLVSSNQIENGEEIKHVVHSFNTVLFVGIAAVEGQSYFLPLLIGYCKPL